MLHLDLSSTVFNKIRQIIKNPDFIKQYYYRTKNLASILGIPEDTVKEYFTESLQCWDKIESKMNNITGNVRTGIERLQILYTCVRSLKPDIMVETGVAGGSSSLTILYAMEKNGKGKLHSIDIDDPNYDKRTPNYSIGWMIPQELKHNWNLIIGDSKKELPLLLNSLKKIDVFFHDSNHTYDHMIFEFNTVLPFLQPPQIILSDDINLNSAFDEFVKQNKLRSEKFYGFGVAMAYNI